MKMHENIPNCFAIMVYYTQKRILYGLEKCLRLAAHRNAATDEDARKYTKLLRNYGILYAEAYMYYFANFNLTEISKMSGKPHQNISYIQVRALRKLHEIMEGGQDE